ncbi:hypothetical protein, partial [Burkholderia sp. BCC1638]|uniref:hypothetical protein n=1 Tax=Burkholderia sp. BCC1638 TaxID=2681391 RepID=UPI001ABAA376
CAGFALDQRDVVAPIVEGHVPLEAAFVACDLLGVGDDAEICLRISVMVIRRFGERDQFGRWCCAVNGL